MTTTATEQLAAGSILLVDDDSSILEFERCFIERAGYGPVIACQDSRDAVSIALEQKVSLVLLDLHMPHVSGEDILKQFLELEASPVVIVLTGGLDISLAVRCMKLGALDYLEKPITGKQLVKAVELAMAQSAVQNDIDDYRREALTHNDLEHPQAFEGILSNDASMWQMFRHVETIARGSHPVLILGETGTGKELIARALHKASGVDGPFVAVNVAGLDDNMFSDALFGHCAGAFTSALGERKGMIDAAAGGTLFLDEIGDLSESSQVKLLRLLQEGEYYRVGGDQRRSLQARIVTATHKDPAALRQDLYYRLRAYRVDIPALRDRLSDLPILIEHFLKKAARDLGRRKPAVPSELYVYLSNYGYPGNIRELEALVFDAMSKHGQGVMSLKTFNAHIRQARKAQQDGTDTNNSGSEVIFPSELPSMREIEGRAVKEALDRTGGNQTAAARLLGVSRPTISRHLRRASS